MLKASSASKGLRREIHTRRPLHAGGRLSQMGDREEKEMGTTGSRAPTSLSAAARAELDVMISGGFSLAYRELLPAFERITDIAVATASAASQGTGANTMKAQLERGSRPDVVILSREGLSELTAAGRIVAGSDVDLARVPLGAAVRVGKANPQIDTVDAFKQTLLNARSVALPGSTSGIFLMNEVLPGLRLADKVTLKIGARGADATAMVAAGDD